MKKTVLFTELTEDKELLKALARMKFEQTTPVQAAAIPLMKAGKDVTVQAPTGTGKTGAFGLPILENINPADKTLQALILSPTRELAIQITDVLKAMAIYKPQIRITTIYGGESIEKQFALLRRRPQVVVATPGRLLDHMDRNTIKLTGLSMLVLDEADRMLDMGFRPDLNRILKTVPKERQTALFSATISSEIEQIAKSYQRSPESITIEQGALTVDSVEQYYTLVKRNSKMDELVALFVDKHPKRTIVFSNTKRMSENIVFKLKNEGYRAAYLHGDLRQGQRNRVMSQYKTGKIDILVATDVAARGIDVENIDMVINYDLPREQDSYIHRIGRTGRAEQSGVAYTFIYRNELVDIEKLMLATKAKITLTEAFTGSDPVPARSEKSSGGYKKTKKPDGHFDRRRKPQTGKPTYGKNKTAKSGTSGKDGFKSATAGRKPKPKRFNTKKADSHSPNSNKKIAN